MNKGRLMQVMNRLLGALSDQQADDGQSDRGSTAMQEMDLLIQLAEESTRVKANAKEKEIDFQRQERPSTQQE